MRSNTSLLFGFIRDRRYAPRNQTKNLKKNQFRSITKFTYCYFFCRFAYILYF